MAQNEPARATIEVKVLEAADCEMGALIQLSSGTKLRIYTKDNAKPLNAAAEALLNPKNEVVEVAKRLYIASCISRGTDPCWDTDTEREWVKECFLAEAREVCRMIAEELKLSHPMVHGGQRPCVGACYRCKRIAEHEAMAKAE